MKKTFIHGDPQTVEDIHNLYELDTGKKVKLTESSLGELLDWIKDKHPEYLELFNYDVFK